MTHSCIKTISRFWALNIPWTSPTSMSGRFEQHHGIHLCRLGCWMSAGRKRRFKKVDGLVGLVVSPRQRQHCRECFFAKMLNGCFCLVSPQILVFQSLESSIRLAVMVPLSVSPRQNSFVLRALRTMCWFMLNRPWRSKVHLLTLLSSIQICQWPTSFGWVRTGYLELVGLPLKKAARCMSPWNTRGVSPVLTRKARILSFCMAGAV